MKKVLTRKSWRSHKLLIGSLCLYFFLGLFGINQSSLNTISLDGKFDLIQSYSNASLSLGPHRFIRSDEFLRSTPMQISAFRNQGNLSNSILSVDPSSRITKGAVLGDRIRITQNSAFEEIYFRSLATRVRMVD
jgi:hypothetical protein